MMVDALKKTFHYNFRILKHHTPYHVHDILCPTHMIWSGPVAAFVNRSSFALEQHGLCACFSFLLKKNFVVNRSTERQTVVQLHFANIQINWFKYWIMRKSQKK